MVLSDVVCPSRFFLLFNDPHRGGGFLLRRMAASDPTPMFADLRFRPGADVRLLITGSVSHGLAPLSHRPRRLQNMQRFRQLLEVKPWKYR